MRLHLKRLTLVGLVTAVTLAAALPGHAGQRRVSVNGVWLGPADQALADRNAGYRVPDGYYWYDPASGYWGLLGGPALGWVPPAASQGRSGGTYHAGPGGYTGSDGSCSYFFDPQSGASVMSDGC